MAITKSTLASAMTASDLIANLTSASGVAAGNFLKIDSEYMVVDRSYVSGTAVPVFKRGDQGSAVVAHNALAICSNGLFSDLSALAAGFDAPEPGLNRPIATYSVDGAITVPTVDTVVVLDKATAAAMTLAAPTADLDGMILTITSTTAVVHVITATSLIADGTSGSPHTTITFTTGYKGQGCQLMALAGLWQLISNTATTIT